MTNHKQIISERDIMMSHLRQAKKKMDKVDKVSLTKIRNQTGQLSNLGGEWVPRKSAVQALKCLLTLSINLSSESAGCSLWQLGQKNLSYSTHFLTGTHTYIDAPTHAHSHSHKHMRMRHISTGLHCWIHPNMVGDISMATAGRRGADLSWMISRDSLLFDF